MTIQQHLPTLERADVDRLAEALHRAFETAEVDPTAVAEDVFCDLLPPLWRFQVQGRDALAAQLRATTAPGTAIRPLRVVPTAEGFVAEHELTEHADDGTVTTARRLVLCAAPEGAIAEILVYCNGPWDDELRARHAADAPMIRA